MPRHSEYSWLEFTLVIMLCGALFFVVLDPLGVIDNLSKITKHMLPASGNVGQSAGGVGGVEGVEPTNATFEVYGDSLSQYVLSSINWGMLNPGSTGTKDAYVKNMGDAVFVDWNVTTENWIPSEAEQYMLVSLIFPDGLRDIEQSEVLHVQFVLNVASNITGITNFSFDIMVTGYYK